jgi:hypothetical protein
MTAMGVTRNKAAATSGIERRIHMLPPSKHHLIRRGAGEQSPRNPLYLHFKLTQTRAFDNVKRSWVIRH